MEKPFSPDDIFAQKHFNSIRIKFQKGLNHTTRTEVKSPHLIAMPEFDRHGFVVELPVNSCSVGHNLEFVMSVEIPVEAQIQAEEISLTCQVTSKEPLDNKLEKIRVTLIQYDEGQWSLLFDAIEQRQAEILEFLKAAKG